MDRSGSSRPVARGSEAKIVRTGETETVERQVNVLDKRSFKTAD